MTRSVCPWLCLDAGGSRAPTGSTVQPVLALLLSSAWIGACSTGSTVTGGGSGAAVCRDQKSQRFVGHPFGSTSATSTPGSSTISTPGISVPSLFRIHSWDFNIIVFEILEIHFGDFILVGISDETSMSIGEDKLLRVDRCPMCSLGQ